jgi:hypothetical protein
VKLLQGYHDLAVEIQEASNAGSLMHSDVSRNLAKAVSDMHGDSDSYGYYMDHAGDDQSGDVVYRSNGKTMKAPYEVSTPGDGNAAVATIDGDNAQEVQGRMVYEPVCDDGDYYSAMEAALVKEGLYTSLPLYERFVSKGERDQMSSDDFAGKGKSYPISKPEDVSAAASSIGRAGAGNYSPSALKARIIAIAKRKGWTKNLPKSWQDGGTDSKEGAKQGTTAPINLHESADGFPLQIPLAESGGSFRTTYPIKIISPGVGSSAHYSEGMLRKAVEAGRFKAGTMMYWNHPTAQQESSRPEGDLNDLAAITSKDGYWDSNGVKGPGVYAEAKVMADYAERISERAPHIGVSIRAGGTGTGKKVEGKPDLASIDYVESVDYVTRAGRGGMALAEAAKFAGLLPENSNEVDMDEAKIKQLIQEALAPQQGITATLMNEQRQREAIGVGSRTLQGVDLPMVSKERIINAVIARSLPMNEAGALDERKFAEAVIAEAQAEGRYITSLTGRGNTVRGLGESGVIPAQLTEAERTQQLAETKVNEEKREKRISEAFKVLTGNNTAAAKLAREGRPNTAAREEVLV